MESLLEVFDNVILKQKITVQERKLILIIKEYFNQEKTFWNIYNNDCLDSERLKRLGSYLNSLKGELNKGLAEIFKNNSEIKIKIKRDVYTFAQNMLFKYNDLPDNLNDIYVCQCLKTKNKHPENYLVDSYYNYNLFYDIYEQFSYEGIGKFLLIDKNLNLVIGKGIFEILASKGSVTREDILNLSSPSSIMQNLSYKNQARIIASSHFNQQPINEDFINTEFPNAVVKNSPKKVYFL